MRCIPSQRILTPGSPSPFRARKPPQPGNQAHLLIAGGWLVRWFLLIQAVGRFALVRLEHQLGAFNALKGAQLQSLNATTIFEHMKGSAQLP